MKLHIPTVLLTLAVAAALFVPVTVMVVAGRYEGATRQAVTPVERKLTAEQVQAVSCLDAFGAWWDSPEDSPEEDAAFDGLMDVCLP